MRKRILNILIALDQLLYVLLTLGKGYPDLTISAAMYYKARNGNKVAEFFRVIIDFLFWPIEKDHCFESFVSEVRRNHVPPEMRNINNSITD